METIMPGQTVSAAQNVIYALPPQRCVVYCDGTSAALEVSNDTTFTTKAALTLTAGQSEANGRFIRSTGAVAQTLTVKI